MSEHVSTNRPFNCQIHLSSFCFLFDFEQQEEWDKHSKELANFIFTKAKPRIFYLPKVHTAESLKKLEESREQIKGKTLKPV